MDFDLTEEQTMLVASCERLVRERCTFESRRAQARQLPQMRPPLWAEMVELGLAGILVPEASGGMQRPLIDAALVAQALGRGWLLEPYVDCALAAATVLARVPQSAARETALAAIARGLRIIVPATQVRAADGEIVVQAPHGAYADLVLAPLDGRLLGLMTAPARKRGWRQLDGTAAAELACPEQGAMLLAEGETAQRAWRAGQAVARIGRIAEGVGLSKRLLDVTAEYLRTRKQFGQPLGRFQALAHRMADLALIYQQALSLMLAAAMRAAPGADGSAGDARTLDAAQVMAQRAFRQIGQQAIQLHGGIGMTDELAASHFVKRLLAIELELGDADGALRRFAAAAAAD